MTLIDRWNAFWAQDAYNPISVNAKNLYMSILAIFNRAQWKTDELAISNGTLSGMSSMNEKQLCAARAELAEAGLIEFTAGKKRTAPRYRLIDLDAPQEQPEEQSEEQTEEQFGNNSGEKTELIRDRKRSQFGCEFGVNLGEKTAVYIEKDKEKEKDKDKECVCPPTPQGESAPSAEKSETKKTETGEKKGVKPETIMPTDPESCRELYNSVCVSLPKCAPLTPRRRKAVEARLKRFTPKELRTAFTKAQESSFLRGERGSGWKASFDWIMQRDSNVLKILNGYYDDAPAVVDISTRTEGIAEIEAEFMSRYQTQ